LTLPVYNRPGDVIMDSSLLRNDRSEAMDRSPVDMAWLVLEAANDLGDDAAVEACRRVIDASLNGGMVAPADLHVVQHYFR
jgi:hypothetical protein